MAEITKQDLAEALKEVARKRDFEGLRTEMATNTGLGELRTEIKSDIQGIGKKLDKVQKDISNIKVKLGVEV